MFVLTGSELARRSPLSVSSSSFIEIYLKCFVLIPSVILGNSRSYPIGILKWEHILKSLSCLCTIIAVIYDLSHYYISTNNNYDTALN